MLDDGRVTDSQGRVVSFRNSIVILTSNIGTRHFAHTHTLNFPSHSLINPPRRCPRAYSGSSFILEEETPGAARERVMSSVRAHFRPEFVNRVDEYIIFEPLRKTQIERIVRLQIARVAGRLASRKMALKLTDAAVEHLADVGYDPVYGARPVKRAIQHGLETMLAQAILRGDFNEEDTIYVDVAPDAPPRLALSRTPPGSEAAGAGKRGAAAVTPPPAQAAG
jgi:ATP-dependent Clp protease ATP-binding subunit ClpB